MDSPNDVFDLTFAPTSAADTPARSFVQSRQSGRSAASLGFCRDSRWPPTYCETNHVAGRVYLAREATLSRCIALGVLIVLGSLQSLRANAKSTLASIAVLTHPMCVRRRPELDLAADDTVCRTLPAPPRSHGNFRSRCSCTHDRPRT